MHGCSSLPRFKLSQLNPLGPRRESLVTALVFVLQQDKLQTGNISTQNEAANVQGKVQSISQCAASALTTADAAQGQG